MMSKYSGLFFIVHLIKISFLDAYTQSCNASLETVVQVARCPTSNASYEEAARQKNCSSLPLDKTGCGSFQYHCVLSEDLNAAVEVCAPSMYIIDYVCTMFSSKFKSIMRVHGQSCGNSKAGCPYSYNSTLAFMYQQCYTKIYDVITTETTPRLNSFTTKGLSKTGLENSEDKSWIAGVVIGAILLIVIIAGMSIICWKRNKRNKRKENRRNRQGDIEMDVVKQDNGLQNRNQMDPLMPVNNDKIENNENKLSAEMKTEVSTEVNDKRIILECAVNSLIESLKHPERTWKKETILGEIQNLINEIQDAGDRQLLMAFVEKLNKDQQIQNKLIECGVEMHQIFLDVLHKYDATKLSMDKGCVCFLIHFSDDNALKAFLHDFQQGDKSFINCISRILLNKKFLGIFQINPEIVTWKSSEMKIYKGSKLLQEENLEVPIVGTYSDITEDDEDKLLEEDKKERILEDFKETPNKYPAYHLVKTRELSFESCENSSIKERACEFARDGFFYEGYGLVTTCFHCGLHKDDWKQDDDIHAEHKKLNETCAFVRYVQLHISKKK